MSLTRRLAVNRSSCGRENPLARHHLPSRVQAYGVKSRFARIDTTESLLVKPCRGPWTASCRTSYGPAGVRGGGPYQVISSPGVYRVQRFRCLSFPR